MTLQLNQRAGVLADAMAAKATALRIKVRYVGASRLLDLGIELPGGLEAGRLMAEVCLAGLGEVQFGMANPELGPGPSVVVRTDHPVAACMGSQYAGWEIKGEGYFAMGSGPMRAAAGRETLFDSIGCRERAENAVGVLETNQFPPEAISRQVADDCQVPHHLLTLLVAPTNSLAGNVQIVARSVETALHKLHELEFDLSRIESAWGSAPLPPVAGDALSGIGRTNDAILYGGYVILYVRGDDDSLARIGPQIPSSASSAHGRPFKEVLSAHDNDFYKIDPLLFSPAVVEFVNLDTGRVHRHGKYAPKVLKKSFGAG
jgi:methenyltetrahydromethanopterin cyclohydrolase